MRREIVEAIFLLSEVELYAVTPVRNQYGSGDWRGPWWECLTPHGMITIGWRKRVIEIDWSTTNKRGDLDPKNELVTKSDTFIHAWGYPCAIQYLSRFATIKESV